MGVVMLDGESLHARLLCQPCRGIVWMHITSGDGRFEIVESWQLMCRPVERADGRGRFQVANVLADYNCAPLKRRLGLTLSGGEGRRWRRRGEVNQSHRGGAFLMSAEGYNRGRTRPD